MTGILTDLQNHYSNIAVCRFRIKLIRR